MTYDETASDDAIGNVCAPASAPATRDGSEFNRLDPNLILDAVDSSGLMTDGRVSALNSYENRVYQIGIEDSQPVVAKFYRPVRWSDDTILEEHAFTCELVENDLPVIRALTTAELANGARYQTDVDPLSQQAETENSLLHHFADYRFAIYPRAGGRPPELDDPDQLEVIGRTLARLHLVGELSEFKHRPTLDPMVWGQASKNTILQGDFLPAELREVYQGLVEDILNVVGQQFSAAGSVSTIRLHGDFHPGNILWGADDTPHLLDFDDCIAGPAIQDLWMFLSGDREYRTARVADILEGYTQFRDFDPRELQLVEPLRSLRQIHYAAWIAKRWNDPAFAKAFPFFAEQRYWDEHILALREQRAMLDEPPVKWD